MALAQAPAKVKVGNDLKNAFGTVTEMNLYNFRCFIGFTDDQGADFHQILLLGLLQRSQE